MFCPNNVDSLPELMSTNCPNWGGQLPPLPPVPYVYDRGEASIGPTAHGSHPKCVISLNLPPLPEEEYPLSVRSICLDLFQNTLYHLLRREAEDGRGLRRANISKWQPHKCSTDMHRQMLYNYYKPKSGLCYKDPRDALPLCRNDIESVEKHYVCKIRL